MTMTNDDDGGDDNNDDDGGDDDNDDDGVFLCCDGNSFGLLRPPLKLSDYEWLWWWNWLNGDVRQE